MKIKAMVIGVIASLTLAMSVGAEGVTVYGFLDKGNDLLTPGMDVWNVKCAAVPTTIRARAVVFNGQEEAWHVTVLCIEPLSQRGKGDKEIGVWPERTTASEWAEAPLCREAFVELGCDHNAPCGSTVGNYLIQIECQGAAFLPGSLNLKINR